MDLVTLVTGCALTVDPKVMHALIWQQSGGEPWSFSAPGQGWARVFPTLEGAIREARASVGGRIRIGLSGLPADGQSASAAMFAPCPNITVAASEIAQLAERCKTLSRFTADPIYCAIAAYHGSWERPDAMFADAVKATVVKGDALNFGLPNDVCFDSNDVAGNALTSAPRRVLTSPGARLDDDDSVSSSALFPMKQPRAVPASSDPPNHGRSAVEVRSLGESAAVPTTTTPPADSLFFPSSTRWRP
jgi:hypothetical protein